MSDFAASVLAPVVESGVKYVVAAIKRQLIYLCCFITNINALKDEATKLDEAIVGVQAKVDAAKNNLLDIHPEVTSWCVASDNYKTKTNTILEEVPNVRTDCLRVASRFSLSKRAKKTTEAMAQHREKSKLFVDVSLPPPSAASRPTPLGTTYEFDSRKKIEQDIMTALRDGHEKMIGICGMGGMGKTTMAKRIMNRALEEHLFQEVVMAVVSQPVDRLKLQVEIGRSLGLKGLENEPAQARVQKLYERLSSDTKKILLVLDDVWKNLNLNELGIPCELGDSKRCTILITSRNGDTLREMDVKKVFGIESLSEEDAWFLFRKKAGTCVDDRKLKSTAEKVVEKCRGLPIALITVGVAFKDEKSMSVWKDALKQLRKPNPNNTPSFIVEVYNPLILSYDRLDSEEAKSLFLLCCLYPEDANIPIDDLTYFCMGLRIFTDLRSLEEVRDRICTLIKSLKSRSLLLDGDRDCVRMHDVVRDVCIFISKQKGYIGDNDCTWISSAQLPRDGIERPTKLGYPNLRLLFSRGIEITIENLFLGMMRELFVVSIEDYSWTSLPHTTQLLSNVRTLVLDSCKALETISNVGSLINLEILICRQCPEIKELPGEIKGLMHLKLLELTGCFNLRRIAPTIISSLVGLEELKMFKSFDKWEADDGERQNAGLRELESLTKLTCLEIEIANPTLTAQQINLSSKIERFSITIGRGYYYGGFPEEFNKKMDLRWKGKICLGHWMEKLLDDTECLYFTGNGANNLDLASIRNIKELFLNRCDTMKNIGATSMDDDGGAVLFLHMEILKLSNLPQIQEIWNGPISPYSFRNLKEIRLVNFPELKKLWTTSMDDDGGAILLPHMERLKLSNLPQLQEIWSGPIPSNSFQNLKEIQLENLPLLKQLWNSNTGLPQLQSLVIHECEMMEQVIMCREEQIEVPLLARLDIWKCPKLRNIIPTTSLKYADNDDQYSHLFCQPQKVSFGSLKSLEMEHNPFCRHNSIHLSFFHELEQLSISEYHDSMSLFMPSIAQNLTNLKILSITDCDEMLEVIEDDNEEDKIVGGGERYRLFPKLEKLRLKDLSKLVTFCSMKLDIELQSLNEVVIFGCPNMTNFASTLLALKNFKTDLNNYFDVLFKENVNPSCTLQIPLFSFHGLEKLHIQYYRGSMSSIFSSSVARNLVNLYSLHIESCGEIVKVLEEEESVSRGDERTTTILFPNLSTLELYDLPKMEIFCKWEREVKLPSLTKLYVDDCPNMARFTLGSTATPHLTLFRLGNYTYDIDASTDLNGELQKHFTKRQRERRIYLGRMGT